MGDSLFDPADIDFALAPSGETPSLVLARFTRESGAASAQASAWELPAVQSWIRENGRLLKIDLDARPHLAERFRVRITPEVLAIRDGVVVDRLAGEHSPMRLLSWFDRLVHQPPELVRLREAARAGGVRERHALARELLLEQRDVEALEHYLWLWTCGLDQEPGWRGVRHSFLLAEMAELVRRSPPAREAISGYRDMLEAQLDHNTEGVLADWFALNQALGETDRSLRWLAAQPGTAIEALPWKLLQQWLAGPLKARGEWAQVARLYPKPLAALELRHRLSLEMLGGGPQPETEVQQEVRRFTQRSFREYAADLVRSLKAAGRASEAEAVAARARVLDPGPEMRAAIDQAAGSR